jgi:phage/plasmid-like protein (TIGR03299 family)
VTVNTQFSTREVPWMKLGKLIEQPVTANEAAKLAKLDFTVSLEPVYYERTPVGEVGPRFKCITGRKAVVADDNGDFMGFVSSKSYNSLQYGEAFNFMDAISPTYVAAGGLRSRRQGFMVVKPTIVGDVAVLGGGDPHGLYAVLRTSHDCSRATEVSVMMLRNKCMNQLTLQSFTKGVPYRWSIKHTNTQAAKLKEAQESLKNIGLYVAQYAKNVAKMAHTPVNHKKASELLRMTIKMPKGKTQRTEDQYNARIEKLLELFETSPQVGFAGTGWGLVNTVSEYYEWHRTGGTAESRFIGALEGQTHKMINRMATLVLSGA